MLKCNTKSVTVIQSLDLKKQEKSLQRHRQQRKGQNQNPHLPFATDIANYLITYIFPSYLYYCALVQYSNLIKSHLIFFY